MKDHDSYMTVLDGLRDPVLVLDGACVVERVNLAASALLATLIRSGSPPQRAAETVPEWLQADLAAIALAPEAGHAPQRKLNTSSGIRFFEVECQRMFDADNALTGAVIILHDVTDLREAEQEARYRSEFARVVAEISTRFVGVYPEDFDHAMDTALERIGRYSHTDAAYICQFSRDGQTLSMTHSWNSDEVNVPDGTFQELATAAVPTWSRQILSGNVVAIGSPDELPPEAATERALLASLRVESVVNVPLSYKNEVVGFLGLASMRPGRSWIADEINLLQIAGQVFTNALQQKNFEEALAQERNLLRTVIDNLPDYIYAKDAESRFILNNKAHLRLLKASQPEDVFDKRDYDIFPEELAGHYYEDEQAVIRTDTPLVNREESVITEAGERRWLLTTKVPLRDSAGRPIGIVGMSRDITMRKRMAEELESHARLLEQANADLRNRNQELDDFTYIASHDLQEPLRKLISFSDVLSEDLASGDTEGVARALKTIVSAARRMKTLVEDLLALSRSGRQSMHLEDVDLAECVETAVDILEVRIAEERAEICEEALPTVYGDRMLLSQLYQNLIGNALKFHGDATPMVKLTAEMTEYGWVLGVKDNGIGLKPDYAEQIFAPFKRLHGRGRYEGTGIGLAICRKIVERHEGKIWVESNLGHGAHFKFMLGARREEKAT